MPFQDSNPERRNLVVTSVAFIAYYYGGGELVNNSISLPVVSIHLTNPAFIAFMAWAGLFWFLYRYWLLHSGEFVENFPREFHSFQDKAYVRRYAERRTGKQFVGKNDKRQEGSLMQALLWRGGCVRAPYVHITNITRDKNGAVVSYTPGLENEVTFSDIVGWLLAFRLTAVCFFRKPSFSNYLMPYLFFICAALGGIYRHLF